MNEKEGNCCDGSRYIEEGEVIMVMMMMESGMMMINVMIDNDSRSIASNTYL